MVSGYRRFCLENGSEEVEKGKGLNIIPPPKREPLWMGLLRKFGDPLIVVLLVVFLFSMMVSVYEVICLGDSPTILIEPLGILTALLLATGVGFIFEVRAEGEFRILNQKKDERPVKVLRWKKGAKGKGSPQAMKIKKCDVVVGDVVSLESGDEVPADGNLLRSVSLMVDESAFTGEMYASKTTELSTLKSNSTYRDNFLLRGSLVIEGNCHYKVTAVGMDTEEGRGARIINEEKNVETPLNKQLGRLSNFITKASYIIALLILIGRLTYFFFFDGNPENNRDILEITTFSLNSIMIAVTLVVVAVPEGLPMSVTISLALSMKKMLKENNLVRKLHACETMGAATVICTDKTGTLTKNVLKVAEERLYADEETVARCIAANSTAELALSDDGNHKTIGNPTEGSLLYWLLEEKGIDYRQLRDSSTLVSQIPFSPETKMMTTIAKDDCSGYTYKYIKGAPELIIRMCGKVADGSTMSSVERQLDDYQTKSYRTLAVAFQNITEGKETEMHLAAIVGMSDPIREDVCEAIETCKKAGIRIIMVTGDVAATANQIARDTGIMSRKEPPQNMIGEEFASMSDEELIGKVLPSLKILSRARPADKARLVGLLQEMGEVVAVTGDGTNDAPALKKAQVGLSMGDGTSSAKEASDITIIDNSFSSINTAILWGRSLYLNIRRFIIFQMTINVCACLIVLTGAFIGLDSPLTVTQMLWVNLIMDTFAALALSSLPPDKKVMSDKPRDPDTQIIDGNMTRRILFVGLVIFAFMLGLWQLLWHLDIHRMTDFLSFGTIELYFSHLFDLSKSKDHLTPYELGVFFSVFVMFQFWNLFNARYYKTGRSLIKDLSEAIRHKQPLSYHYSKSFLAVLAIILIGQVLIVNVFGQMFNVASLPLSDWLWLLVLTFPMLLVGDLIRFLHGISANRK